MSVRVTNLGPSLELNLKCAWWISCVFHIVGAIVPDERYEPTKTMVEGPFFLPLPLFKAVGERGIRTGAIL